MRIPVDDKTLGKEVKHKFTSCTDIICFVKIHNEDDAESITYGDFKKKYNCKGVKAYINTEEEDALQKRLRELSKNFKFPSHLLQ